MTKTEFKKELEEFLISKGFFVNIDVHSHKDIYFSFQGTAEVEKEVSHGT